MLSSVTNIVKIKQNLKFLVCINQNTDIISRHASNKDYSSSDDEDNKSKPKKEVKQKELNVKAVSRLNQLLASMPTHSNVDLVKMVDLKKVGSKKQKIKEVREAKKAEDTSNTKNVIEAAKSVAKALGGDVKQTESELLSKLLLHSDAKVRDISPNEASNKTPINLSELIVGMKIDKTKKPSDELQTKADYIRRAMNRTTDGTGSVSEQLRQQGTRSTFDKTRRPSRFQSAPGTGSVNLFGSEPLGIFKDPSKLQDSPDILETWSKLKNHEIKLSITHPPANYFEKMILWTEQGKVWKFPIDNEQGLDEESKVYFADHIFLEEHLEGWCPPRGPVRHFMELVCVGLSKNPYITVQAKTDHIMWFKNYFEEKKDILKAVIVDDKASAKQLSQ